MSLFFADKKRPSGSAPIPPEVNIYEFTVSGNGEQIQLDNDPGFAPTFGISFVFGTPGNVTFGQSSFGITVEFEDGDNVETVCGYINNSPSNDHNYFATCLSGSGCGNSVLDNEFAQKIT